MVLRVSAPRATPIIPKQAEEIRDDGPVPELAARGEDAQDEHDHAGDRAELEHLVGARVGAEGRCSVLARDHRVDQHAADGQHDRDREADRQGLGGEELPDFGADQPACVQQGAVHAATSCSCWFGLGLNGPAAGSGAG
jgi:hypothetical protein